MLISTKSSNWITFHSFLFETVCVFVCVLNPLFMIIISSMVRTLRFCCKVLFDFFSSAVHLLCKSIDWIMNHQFMPLNSNYDISDYGLFVQFCKSMKKNKVFYHFADSQHLVQPFKELLFQIVFSCRRLDSGHSISFCWNSVFISLQQPANTFVDFIPQN